MCVHHGERQNWRHDGGDRWERGLRSAHCHCPVGSSVGCAAACILCRCRITIPTHLSTCLVPDRILPALGNHGGPDKERFTFFESPGRTTMVYNATRDHVGVCSPFCCPWPWWRLKSVRTYAVCAHAWSPIHALVPWGCTALLQGRVWSGQPDMNSICSHLMLCWGQCLVPQGRAWVDGPDAAEGCVGVGNCVTTGAREDVHS